MVEFTGKAFTIGDIAKIVNASKQQIGYVIDKLKLDTDHRCGITRLFTADQVEAIKVGLLNLKPYKGRNSSFL